MNEDDFPTGPIDVWPLMAEDAPAEAFVVIDANGAAHGKSDGRFVRKEKTVWTWDEVQRLPEGSEYGPTIFQWPDEPGVRWETKHDPTGKGAWSSCRPLNSSSYVPVAPKPNRREVPPDGEVIRAWARRHGYPVNARGRLSKAVTDAYMAAHRR